MNPLILAKIFVSLLAAGIWALLIFFWMNKERIVERKSRDERGRFDGGTDFHAVLKNGVALNITTALIAGTLFSFFAVALWIGA